MKMNNDLLFPVYSLFDIEPVKGEGFYVFDASNNCYLDLYGGHAVISIGHSHPHYVEMIQRQLKRLSFYSNSVKNRLQTDLAEKLSNLSGCTDYHLFLCNSGAEANENALKLASFHNRRQKVVAFKKGFHGRTSAAVNVTDSQRIKAPINTTFEAEFHDWNDLEGVIKSIQKRDVCAVIIEGVQGIGGIYVPDPIFLMQLEKLCRTTDTVLILDEIQSGYGRSGCFFGFQPTPIQPDLITLAKGMGNGFPIGGVLIHSRFKAEKGMLGSTFGGNHLACAAGIAVLDVISSENLMDNARKIGSYLIRNLKEMKVVKEIRGRGLMIGIEMDYPIAPLRKKLLFEEKIFTGSSSNKNTIRILPPLNIDQSAADYFLTCFKKVISQV